MRARAPIPVWLTSRILRWFHGAAAKTLVPTRRIKAKLEARGFRNLEMWTRGVDTTVFTTDTPFDYDLPRPIWVHMGRIAVEKSIEKFLELELPGSKVVIGDGPARPGLERQFPDACFVGYRFGRELASYLAGGDVFVFPSHTDTFGLVMLEAMACGLPIAAYPVDGPVDVVSNGVTGILDDDLGSACIAALALNRQHCREYAEQRSWRTATRQLERHLLLPDSPPAARQGATQARSSASMTSPL
ncbi:MAG: glycosyltransferase [Woeseiaceae bacterium]